MSCCLCFLRTPQIFWICRITPEWREHKSTNVFQYIQYCWLNNNVYLPTVQPLCWCKFWFSSKIRTFLLKCPVKKTDSISVVIFFLNIIVCIWNWERHLVLCIDFLTRKICRIVFGQFYIYRIRMISFVPQAAGKTTGFATKDLVIFS